ncbi:MAG: hypothetical protein O2871_02770 [bacterium]|nr:hypothetical protein [bacterium]
MSQTLRINATNARKNLFKLLDQVALNNLSVYIYKEGLENDLVLQNIPKVKSNKQSNLNNNKALVKKTYGAIKTKGYKPNEFELAKKHLVKRYKNNNGIK